MNADVQWILNAGSGLLWAGTGVFVIYLAISLYHLKQVQFAPYRLLTEGIKFLGACMLFLTVLGPEIHTRSVREDQARMAVILDRTDSMQTRDVETAEGLISREDSLNRLLASDSWQQLAEDVELTLIEMGHSESGNQKVTDFGAVLSAAQDGDRLAAVVMLSDGRHNADASPLPALLQLSQAKVPGFAFAIGAEQRLPDLALTSAVFPSYAILNETMVVPFSVRNSLSVDTPIQVSLIADGEVVARQELDVNAGEEKEGSLRWIPRTAGDAQVTVRLDPHPSEKLPENNERVSQVEIRKTDIRVLVIDSLPRWEIRFLRNALHRDPGVTVDTLFYHPDLEPQSGPGLLSALPKRREVWSEYDVIFVGDVGIGEGELDDEDADNLTRLVQEQGSGLVFLPGARGGQLRLADSALDALMPVELDPAAASGVGSATPMQLSLTRTGKTHMLTQLASSPVRSEQIWRRLPGFHWYAGVSRARVGAKVLATHRSQRNDTGRIPLLASRDSGTGHVLFMGTDGAWRWRRGVEDLYHYRFWGQVVRWMAHKRNMFGEDGARFFLQPERPQAGQEVTLTLNLRGGRALTGEIPFELRLRHEEGQVLSPVITELEGGGTYQATFTPDLPGEMTLELWDDVEEGASPWFEVPFQVEGQRVEQVGEPMQIAPLQQLADITGGALARSDETAALIDRLRQLPRERRILTVNRLWQKPWWILLLFTFFTLYWILRKRKGWV